MRVVKIRDNPIVAHWSLEMTELGGFWTGRLPHAIPAHDIDLLGSPIHYINIFDLFRVHGGLTGRIGWGRAHVGGCCCDHWRGCCCS